MDTDRFDALTRGLIAGPSRRGLLRTFLGSGVAIAGVVSMGIPSADARKRKRKKKKKCNGGETLCGNQCFDLQTDTNHCGNCDISCKTGETCVNGNCRCSPGQVDCGNGCIDVTSNPQNCGACGNACGFQRCGGGVCLTACSTPSEPGALVLCPADPGGICVGLGDDAVCAESQLGCEPFARDSCDGEPCPVDRICATVACANRDFICLLPAS